MTRQFTLPVRANSNRTIMSMLPTGILREQAGGRQRWNVLEVGVFEGETACALFDDVLEPESLYTGVDSWAQVLTKKSGTGDEIQARARANLQPFLDDGSATLLAMEFFRAASIPSLMREKFDLIHIDGDHMAPAVALDTVIAWPLLKPGGIMVWDNYERRVRRSMQVRPVVDWFLKSVVPVNCLWWYENCSYAVRKAPEK